MKAIGLGVLGVILLVGAPAAPAQLDLPPAAKEMLEQFDEEAAAIEKKIEPDITKRREKTAVELKKIQDLLCKEAKLDEAVAVRDLIRSLQTGTNVVLSKDLPTAALEVYKQ